MVAAELARVRNEAVATAKARASMNEAAPEMADACREMLLHVNASHVPAEVIDKMRAAIAKAEGRS